MAAMFTRKGCNTQTTLYNLWKQHQVMRNPKVKQPCKEYSKPHQSYDKMPMQLNLVAPPRLVVPPAFTSSKQWVPSVGLVSWYLGMVKSWPVITKGVTCGLIYTASDFTSQALTMESGDSYDLARTARMAGIGVLMIGPSLHYWFNFAAKLFPSTNIISTMKKIALGHILYSPIAASMFFGANAALQGENGKEIIARLKRDVMPAIVNGLAYWSVADFIIYKSIPVHLQPLGSNVFVYIWSVYVIYLANLKKVEEI